MKKLNLSKVKSGQTVYYINDNVHSAPRGTISLWIEKLAVTSKSEPEPGMVIFQNGEVARESLIQLGLWEYSNSVKWLKATRNQAKRQMEEDARRLRRQGWTVEIKS